MTQKSKDRGDFTLPGEAGYEALTLALAEKWGADFIRDSDGTTLSGALLDAGYGIYSTLCVVRNHNAWARENLDARQQCILCTQPEVCEGEPLRIPLLRGFSPQQFEVNASPGAMVYWQVYDRTTDSLCAKSDWDWDASMGTVIVRGTPWHTYTVSFFASAV